MKSYRVVTLDAFTTTIFAGNPCAVLPEADGLSDGQMQAIARETNLSETAFVSRSDKADFRVRYFTPRYEIPFAGHPTIATSFLLGLEKMIPSGEQVAHITLEFNIGVLPVEVCFENGLPSEVIMTQGLPKFGQEFSASAAAACFGLTEADLRSDCPVQVVSTGVAFLLVPVKSVDVLGKVQMDRARLSDLLKSAGVDAAFMFCLGGFDRGADTHARLLDPKSAFEDPFTGSAAGSMGAYIAHYGLKEGAIVHAEQGHFVGRPGMGVLEITQKDKQITGVRLAGKAVKVMEGQIFVEP